MKADELELDLKNYNNNYNSDVLKFASEHFLEFTNELLLINASVFTIAQQIVKSQRGFVLQL